jgi:hypothetical protein
MKYRPVLTLWQLWVIYPIQLFPPLLFVFIWSIPHPVVYFVFAIQLLTIPLAALPHNRWQLRLLWRVRNFQTVRAGRIVLHFDPEVRAVCSPNHVLQQCQAYLEQLGLTFGFAIRRRTAVYLFATCEEIGTIIGNAVGGYALFGPNALFIGCDDSLNEAIPHELTHLFASRWSWNAPPLLTEGLATWLQKTWGTYEIDTCANRALNEVDLSLPQLLKQKLFYEIRHRHCRYAVAGSFTGFLIRRYGWDQYRKLYRSCNGGKFRPKIEKRYGKTLEQLEKEWRFDLVLRTMLD